MPRRLSPQTIRLILVCLVALIIAIVAAPFLPMGIDWRQTYRPAALALLAGHSPYEVDIYFSAPWALIPLIPLAILPESIGRSFLLWIGLAAFALVAYRLSAKPLALVAFLLSPPVLHCLLNSNIEWMPLLGFIMPPQIGLFLISIKPQIGIGVGLFWLIETWRKGGIREVFRVFAPFTVVLLISFLLFDFWPLRFRETMTLTQAYNASLWPSSLPVGLALLVASIRTRNIRYAMASSPCFSPYVLFHAWSGALAAILTLQAETVAAVVGLWVLVFIRAASGGL
jgi:hypothetical protein